MKDSYRRRLSCLFLSSLLLLGSCFVSGCTKEDVSQTPESLAPTQAATRVPAKTPTKAPATSKPTAKPTVKPTAQTTANPTATPTKTGKKYFTMSFDDGTVQDKRIIQILKKYKVDCVTFFINTGLYGAKWSWVGESAGMPDVHTRLTEAEICSGIYKGYDVAVHTLTHPSLIDCENDKVLKEVGNDATNIKSLTGIQPVGMAWPGVHPAYTKNLINTIVQGTTVRFARTTKDTSSYRLPAAFMEWHPTCSMSSSMLMPLAKRFLKRTDTEDTLFYVWGHGYELDLYDLWDEFEALIKTMSEADNIILVSNTEFYKLYKNKIPSVA